MGDTVDIVDTEVTVDTAVDTEDMVDTVAREKLKLNQKLPLLLLQKLMPKLGVPLDTDTVPDMVLADMEATVLVLPAMEVTVLDTVSGRDLLMPKPGALLDTDTVPDRVLVDMEVTDTVDTDTESKFCVSMSLLPYILFHFFCKNKKIIFQHVSPRVEEEF